MTNVVIYARYSSHNQREESIEGQLRECHEYAQRNEFRVIGEYCDRAITGKTDNRDNFQRMIKDAKHGKFKYVLVYKLDRFARNRYDSAMYKNLLKKHGVKVVSIKENISDSPEGIILESVLEGMAEYYSANLSQNIKRGMTENALQCKYNGSGLPLGYKIGVDKRFEIDPVGARIVQEIFQMYADGRTVTQIIEYCNERGYKTLKGQEFNKNSLRTMLQNDKYIGIYRHSGIVVEGGVPSIIDKDLYEKVQSMSKKNKSANARGKAKAEYLLSTKLYCGHCGALMVGESGTAKNKSVHHYYKCGTRKRLRTCDKATEQRDWIENLVIDYVRNEFLTDENIEILSTKVMELVEAEANDNTLLHEYEAQLKDTQKRIKNIVDLMEEGIASATTKTRLLELEAYEKDLLDNIEKEKIKKPPITKAIIMYWLESFRDGDKDDIKYRRRIIDCLVNRIYLYDDNDGKGKRLVITFNTSSDDTKSIDISDITTIAEEFGYGVSDSTKHAVSEPFVVLNHTLVAVMVHIEKA